MDGGPFCIDSENDYPILVIPKKCTTLETNCDVTENVYIEARITTPDTDGNETCLYTGFLNIKLIDSYDMKIQSMKPQESPGIEDLPVVLADQDRYEDSLDTSNIWREDVPFMRNNCNERPFQPSNVRFSVCHQTKSEHVTVQQHNTYITHNVYNFKDAVHYAHHEDTNRKPEQLRFNSNIFNSMNVNEVRDYEIVLSPDEEDINNRQNVTNLSNHKKRKEKRNGALKQLMSSEIQPVSKQRKTILYLGSEAHRGQTIQQISYNDPELECSVTPTEIDNEVIIEDSKPPPPNQKKYQCAKCQQIFDQLSAFREHMGGHATPRASRYPNRCRSPALPRYVCPDCGKSLKDQHKLELHCMAHGDPDLECPKCGKVFASKFTLRVHAKIHNRKYPCNFCYRTYAEVMALRTHMAKVHFLFMCDACDFIANKNSELLSHRKVHEAVYTDQNYSSDTEYCFYEDGGNLLSAEESGARHWATEDFEVSLNDDEASLNVNQMEKVDGTADCTAKVEKLSDENIDRNDGDAEQNDDIAGQIDENTKRIVEKPVSKDDDYASQDGYESQIGDDSDEDWSQGDEDMSQYDDEDEDYESNSNDDKNFIKCTNNDSVIAKAISNKAFLAAKTKKSQRFNKVCDVCLKRFDRVSDLKRHLIEHVIRSTLAKMPLSKTGILNIECEVCHDHIFHRVDEYKAHLREHAKLTLYRCTFCNKSFSDSSNFSKHKKIHGATYFQCDLCQRKFNSKKMISRHMEYHNQNSPMPCPFCPKKFHFESMLNKHIKGSHTKKVQNKFRCRFCLKHFATLKAKWDHEWSTHKARKMIVDCLLCGAKYRKYSELKRHCQKTHRFEIPPAKRLLTDDYKKSVCYKNAF